MEPVLALSGLLVGAVVGLTGVGGGSLMTPLLVLCFGVAPQTAVGTDLLYATVTKATGVWVHARKRQVDWTVVRRLATGSVPAALGSLLLLRFLDPDEQRVSDVITVTLGVALLLTAGALVFRRRLQSAAPGRIAARNDWRERHAGAATVLTGAGIGALVAVSSVGAGAVGVAVLFWLFPRLSPARIVGSDIAHAVPLTAVAGVGHVFLGSIDWPLLGNLLLGSLPGIWLGSHASSRVPERVLRPALAAMLALVGGRLVL